MSGTRIYKYVVLPFRGTPIPRSAELLQVGQQGDEMVVWAIVDPEQPLVLRKIDAAVTGGEGPPAHAKYINTVQRTDGLVFHFFDEGETPVDREGEP